MTSRQLSRFALSVCMAVAMLAGCGGSQPPIGAPSAMLQPPSGATTVPDHLPRQLTFKFTGQPETWRVPKNVRSITVVAFGAAGDGTGGAGLGGRASAILPVQPGEKLTIVVGGNAYKSQGGYNGGGPGGNYNGRGFGFGGGGSTDIREHGSLLSDRIFVVGGGGGQGAYDQYSGQSEGKGGKGGGRVGGSGGIGFGIFKLGGGGGKGGRQLRGGTGGTGYGTDGSGGSGGKGRLQLGGYGGDGCASCYYSSGGGGGGGGGYYGGGGGGGGKPDETLYCCGGGGGGGGSSYVEATALKYRTWSGWKEATHGLLVLKW